MLSSLILTPVLMRYSTLWVRPVLLFLLSLFAYLSLIYVCFAIIHLKFTVHCTFHCTFHCSFYCTFYNKFHYKFYRQVCWVYCETAEGVIETSVAVAGLRGLIRVVSLRKLKNLFTCKYHLGNWRTCSLVSLT